MFPNSAGDVGGAPLPGAVSSSPASAPSCAHESGGERRKVVLSAVQPSGALTIGNYLGAIKNWVALQDSYDCYYCVADLHAITVRQNPADLRRHTLELFALYLACGIDPARSVLFVQSAVPAHCQLAWILSCYTMFGELSRMTQFKDKSARHADNVNGGLFTYPVLMAADILLYGADAVPVGQDQLQHIELARNIAARFNGIYGDVFTMPEGLTLREGTKITSLQDPAKKMSKSDENENAYVAILDPPDVIRRKLRRAVTDSGAEVRAADEKPGVTNLIHIYSCFTGKSVPEVEREFAGRGYGEFKTAVGEAVVAGLSPVQERYRAFLSDKGELERLMRAGADRASERAGRMLARVMRKVGFVGYSR